VGRYEKGKTSLDFTEARESGSTSLQTDYHASTSPLSFFTGQMPFLLPNQQCQSTEDMNHASGHENVVMIT